VAIRDYDGRLGTARSGVAACARRGARVVRLVRPERFAPPARARVRRGGLPRRRTRPFLPINTVELRRAAIRYLHVIAGCAVPTAEAQVSEAMAGMYRIAAAAGQLLGKKLAATADIQRQILAPIAADLAGLRGRALLLTGFAGALRRDELAAIRVEHLEPCERGLRLTLPHSKDERTGRGVTVAPPYGT
jgi:hypothetical protein